MTIRKLRSTAAYEDGDEFAREFETDIPDGLDDEGISDFLYNETGFGHFAPDGKSLDAFYEIESIDGLEPHILCDWGG
jgi:hypothetical protein